MQNVGMGPPPIDRQRPRRGCLGCLAHAAWILLVVTAAYGVFWVAAAHVFYPWAFYFGGRAHWLPIWQGIGRMHTDQGDYTLTLYIYPTHGGRTFNLPTVRGTGTLCTPRGDRFKLVIYGGLWEKTGSDTNGKTMWIRYYNHSFWGGINGNYEQPPRLFLRGTWQNPDLVMDDGGSLAGTFLPDGSLNKASHNSYYRADAKAKVPIVFHELTGWQALTPDCRAQ